ncbi:intramembrane metalloprotease PrsW [Cohnella sp. CFH 77786]|uniref:glutamic-type intramembrane protease PrsW n=1 Tax=Cohnella sp. CFH 77786 TaxID=2662265 RepID=UPI001C60EE8D|nr:glutamic-type intramembrane protease PrsW [Cohnella sp. CFH 77786]MBW5446669.1 intramembrane metalloprotease PrsW [Cohnella sp. CFH 77786]
MLLSVLAAAIAPGLALLAYFYWKDRYDAEPLSMVVRVFLMGVLIVLPAMVLQRGLTLWMGESPLVYSFVISAAVEELLKFFVLYHIIFNHTEFDEPYDGIVYATAVSLGFATLENVLYAFLQPTTFGTLMVRALLPVSGHALFGVFMGYSLGRAKFSAGKRVKYHLWLAALLPLVWHGVYDFMMLTVPSGWMWIAVPFMLLLWYRGIRRVNRANAVSPFRMLKREEEIKS